MKKNPFQNLTMERSLVAALLIEPRMVDEVSPIVSELSFTNDILGRLYRIVGEMWAASKPIDLATFATECQRQGVEAPDGIEILIGELFETEPSGRYADYYAKTLAACAVRRAARLAVETMGDAIADPMTEIGEVAGACDAALRELLDASVSKKSLSVGDLLLGALDAKARCAPGLLTGFHKLDSMTNGLHPGQLIIIGARTGVGKSALAGNIAANVSARGDGVLLVSLEMSQTDFIYRLVCQVGPMLMYQVRSPKIEFHAPIMDAMNRMNNWKLFIEDHVPQTLASLAATMRMLVRKRGIKLAIVDYLQLIQPDDRRAPREQQVAAITRGLKLLARQLKIPIIALAQLNRSVDSRVVKIPQPSDLRESGACEQDADGIWMLHYPHMTDPSAPADEASLIVAKNRQGPRGDIALKWDGPHFQFTEQLNEEGTDEWTPRF